ncbi:MAG: DUF4142 domain-containing protein, partial [Acidobacteriota bacterium]|nr:DUF4142 domain-containing protein [Acidobacteriota bacterium]
MRRVLIMLVALCTAALAGCGGGSETTTNTGTINAASNAASANTTRSEANSSANTSSTAALSSEDRSFMTEAATGGMAEVELGRLAAEKGQSADVKKFGQRMVDDHSKANDELKQLASKKGVTLPTDLTSEQKSEKEKLSKLSGAAFDKEYMSTMVEDHDKDVKAFQDKSK